MRDFWTWLLSERHDFVEPGVLQGYEQAFRQELARLIQRTIDPALRTKFQEMLHCPLVDRRGNCRSFTDYILSALMKNGIHTVYDMEAALGYVFEKMMMPTTDTGERRATLFGGFEERPYTSGNPLQPRFMKFLEFAVRNIRKGKIPRLARVERRPQGTVSIGLGRQRQGEPGGAVSPDEIVASPTTDADLVTDIAELLRKKEATAQFPLVDLFRAILAGKNNDEVRKQFGEHQTREARKIIVQTVEEYAEATGNYRLLGLLQRLKEPRVKPATPKLPKLSDKERDFASIVSVIERLGRPAGTSDLGKYRRRWLEYSPRNPSSGYRNRLEEVLAMMVQEGALRAQRTKQGAFVYSPGPNYEAYRQQIARSSPSSPQ